MPSDEFGTAVRGARDAPPTLARRAVVEAVGTGLLVAAVVGSGIMGERLAGGNVSLALLANTAATGAALVALIAALGPLSGAHFNPVVTVAAGIGGGLSRADVRAYIVAQVAGGLLGTAVANLMFEGPVFSLSRHVRAGPAQLFSEVVATFGLSPHHRHMRATPAECHAVRRRGLHQCGVLVHGVDVVRQSCGDAGPSGRATRLRGSAPSTSPGSSWHRPSEGP